jgi:hypothetical protein
VRQKRADAVAFCEFPAWRLGGWFVRSISGRQEDPEGTPPQRGFRCTRLLGFRWVARGHALAPAELERCAVFSNVLRAWLSPVALRNSPRGPWTWQRQARINMTRPDAATAEAAWRGAPPWGDAPPFEDFFFERRAASPAAQATLARARQGGAAGPAHGMKQGQGRDGWHAVSSAVCSEPERWRGNPAAQIRVGKARVRAWLASSRAMGPPRRGEAARQSEKSQRGKSQRRCYAGANRNKTQNKTKWKD